MVDAFGKGRHVARCDDIARSSSYAIPLAAEFAGPHYFESDGHRRGVVESIHAGVVPLKYAYAGSAARTHDAFARSDDYLAMLAAARTEAEALLDADVLAVGAAVTIAEVGPGNGVRSGAFLAHLAALGHPCRRYLAVDFSATLLALAHDRMTRALGVGTTVDSEVWDVEGRPSGCLERWRPADGPVVCCLLGQTLGNVESPVAVLANIRAGLRPGDVLLMSVLLGGPHVSASTMLAPYRSSEFRAAAVEPLLAAGIPETDLLLALSFGGGRVTGDAVLRRPAVVGGVPLAAGHQIRCFQSRRFSDQDVIAAVRGTGWCVRGVTVTPGDNHMIVTATRE